MLNESERYRVTTHGLLKQHNVSRIEVSPDVSYTQRIFLKRRTGNKDA